jgi:hypothetical protein
MERCSHRSKGFVPMAGKDVRHELGSIAAKRRFLPYLLTWQRLPGSERIRAVMDLNLDLYAMKGQVADAPRLQRTVICFQRRTG